MQLLVSYWVFQILLLLFEQSFVASHHKKDHATINASTGSVHPLQRFDNHSALPLCSSSQSNGAARCKNKLETESENTLNRTRRKSGHPLRSKRTTSDVKIGGVFWDDVWKSRHIRWVAKTIDGDRMRPSDRQFFHTLIPRTLDRLDNICITLDEKDERDFTLLANISWKDRQPSLRYPAVPEQCAFGRSSGFLCVLLDDGDSCHYVSGWAQDRVQALVDGRHSSCGHRERLRMMMHALGLMHEHDRGDAVRFVALHPRLRTLARHDDLLEYRIPQDDCAVFRQNGSSFPFDYDSVMLHDYALRPNAQQMDFELPLVPRRPQDVRKLLASHKPELSHFDQFKLRHLYGCRPKRCRHMRPCENFGFRDRLCRCVCAPGYVGQLCQHKTLLPTDPCIQTVKRPMNITLNATGCHPQNNQPYNYTIVLSGKARKRFVIRIDMTPLRALLEALRVLPTCEHARVYFSGPGTARPMLICAERLLHTPVTLTTQRPETLLVLVLGLPSPPLSGDTPADPARAAGGVRLAVTAELDPASELTVDTTRRAPATAPSTAETSTATSSTVTSSEATPSSADATPAPPDPLPSPPPPKPTLASLRSHEQSVLDGQAQAAREQVSGASPAATGGAVAAVILAVLAATIALTAYRIRHRKETGADSAGDASEPGDAEPTDGEPEEGVEYADGSTQAAAPQP